MNTPPSLRDLYSPPPTTWTFVPPETKASNSSHSPPESTVYQWSSRPNRDSVFDLSPSINDTTGVNVPLLLKALVASAFLEYGSFVIAMPWDVGRTLLQVQWVPKDAGETETTTQVVEEDEELSPSSDDDESYFQDPTNGPTSRYHAPRVIRERGYVVRRSVAEESTRPEYIIPLGNSGGVWGMMKRVGRFKGEGWLSLWKATLTSCITDILFATIQPVILTGLQAIFTPNLSPFQQPPLLLPITSHLITGVLISPLDLIRTRLVVQSSIPRHKTYTGPLDAFSQISQQEGGLRGMYLHPHLLIPTLIDSALRPIISLALPGIIASYLSPGVAEDTHPIAWSFAELAGSCVSLLVTLPFETVRRRLQVQARGSAKPIKACVETRPAPYNGVVDTLWHVLTEERSDFPGKTRARKDKAKSRDEEVQDEEEEGTEEGWLRSTGVGQLYRGLGMRLGTSAIVFCLAVLSGGEQRDAGWAEL